MPAKSFRYAANLVILAAAALGLGMLMGAHLPPVTLDVVGILGVVLSAILIGVGRVHAAREAAKQPVRVDRRGR